MAQLDALITTLKRQLKAHGKTYADVATLLDLSEASVKRLFAEQNFTLKRVEAICTMLGMDFIDLVLQINSETQKVTQLTQDQEQEIASDLLLLLITVCTINGYSFDDLLEEYNITQAECIQKLARLDRLKIIELLPNNRVKLLIDSNFGWLPNGPIQRFFQERVEKDFFNSKFDREAEQLLVINGLLSNSNNLDFQKKMKRLAREFDELSREDTSLPMNQKHGNTVVLAIRQWQYSLFDKYKK
jgi:transcriptional regulator with XRE-family HTH domain